ncbi:RNA polymerase factor sigma-54 [Psychrobacter sp. HD31]|uniref:RNA polymerase factor sigma-54 n=1 Tax=Psychrobacter sp. HD31 TaxID=3112003 RepID=UPI003DA2D429
MNTSFKSGIHVTAGIAQKLNPQMQQAIRLLAMSSLELEQEVQLQLDSNPLLERIESDDLLDRLDELDTFLVDDFSQNNQTLNEGKLGNNDEVKEDDLIDSYDRLSDSSLQNIAIDTDWDNIYTHGSNMSLSSHQPNHAINSNEPESFQGKTQVTIQDHVRWQLNFKHLSQIDMLIADYLIDAMDDGGFIDINLTELQANLTGLVSFYQWADAVGKDEIEVVLHIIQSCEPTGVGACSLSECLTLQLNQLDNNTPNINNAYELLKHSELLLTNDIESLLAKTGLNSHDIEPALTLIRTLNPAPGKAFINTQPIYVDELESYDVPDVLVTPNDEVDAKLSEKASNIKWRVCLNPETLPKVRINQEYASLIKVDDDSADNQYLKHHLGEAKLFINSIEERNNNLLKVATAIVKRQQQFLVDGAIAMQPLILKEIADEVGLHESTVSRLTTSKSILTPQGLYALKYFFSSSLASNTGAVSATAICAMIKELTLLEDPKKPLSDNAIVQKLHRQGVKISRRTVAKYRESMNIAPSTQRKQKY